VLRELLPERTVVAPRADQTLKDSAVLMVLGPDPAVDRARRLEIQRRQFAVIGLGRLGSLTMAVTVGRKRGEEFQYAGEGLMVG
jgi:hypothetical protein